MKIANIRVSRADEGVIIVEEELQNETGCYVSKSTDDSIEGRYLHHLASVVVDMPRLNAAQFKKIERCLEWGVATGCVPKQTEEAIKRVLTLYTKLPPQGA